MKSGGRDGGGKIPGFGLACPGAYGKSKREQFFPLAVLTKCRSRRLFFTFLLKER